MSATIVNSQQETNLHQFFQTVQGDPILQEQIKTATSPENFSQILVKLGKEKGYIFTEAEVYGTLATETGFEEIDLREKEGVNDHIVARVCRCSRSFASGVAKI